MDISILLRVSAMVPPIYSTPSRRFYCFYLVIFGRIAFSQYGTCQLHWPAAPLIFVLRLLPPSPPHFYNNLQCLLGILCTKELAILGCLRSQQFPDEIRVASEIHRRIDMDLGLARAFLQPPTERIFFPCHLPL